MTETKQVGRKGSKLAENVLALAAQVLDGEFDTAEGGVDEVRLQNKVMLVYRRVSFTPPDGKRLVLEDAETGAPQAPADKKVKTEDTSEYVPGGSSEPEGGDVVAKEDCPDRTRHGVVKRKGESCGSCGYPEADA